MGVLHRTAPRQVSQDFRSPLNFFTAEKIKKNPRVGLPQGWPTPNLGGMERHLRVPADDFINTESVIGRQIFDIFQNCGSILAGGATA